MEGKSEMLRKMRVEIMMKVSAVYKTPLEASLAGLTCDRR